MTSIGRGPRRRRSWWGPGLSHQSFSSLTSSTLSCFRWSPGVKRPKLSCRRDDGNALEVTSPLKHAHDQARHVIHRV